MKLQKCNSKVITKAIRKQFESKSKNKNEYIEEIEKTDKRKEIYKEKKDFKWLLENREKLELKYKYDIQRIIDYVESRGKQNFYKDYEAVVRTWSNREKVEPKKLGQKEHGNERNPSIYNF